MPARVTRDAVIDAILDEVPVCSTRGLANRTIDLVNGFVKRARQGNYAPVYVKQTELDGPEYCVLDAFMPHGQTARPGTAHDLLQRHLLDPARDEFTLVHDMRNENGQPVKHCTVTVSLTRL